MTQTSFLMVPFEVTHHARQQERQTFVSHIAEKLTCIVRFQS